MPEFRAVNRIRHGVANEQGVQTEVVVFEPGEKVTGLSKQDMKALWDAGALEQVEVAGTSKTATESSDGGSGAASAPQGEGAKPTE